MACGIGQVLLSRSVTRSFFVTTCKRWNGTGTGKHRHCQWISYKYYSVSRPAFHTSLFRTLTTTVAPPGRSTHESLILFSLVKSLSSSLFTEDIPSNPGHLADAHVLWHWCTSKKGEWKIPIKVPSIHPTSRAFMNNRAKATRVGTSSHICGNVFLNQYMGLTWIR